MTMNKQATHTPIHDKQKVILISGPCGSGTGYLEKLLECDYYQHLEFSDNTDKRMNKREMDLAISALESGQSVVICTSGKPDLPAWFLGYCECHSIPIGDICLERCLPYRREEPFPETPREKMRRTIRAEIEAEMKTQGGKSNA